MADDIYVGGKQIPNPKGIEVHSDTEVPATEPKNKRATMDIHNPPTSHAIVPERPSADPFEMHGIGFKAIRHQPGRAVPKNHPAVQVSEN